VIDMKRQPAQSRLRGRRAISRRLAGRVGRAILRDQSRHGKLRPRLGRAVSVRFFALVITQGMGMMA